MSETKKNTEAIFDETRMSLGQHLDELRSRIIKCLYGIAVAFVVCLIFCSEIISFLAQPLLWALDANGLDKQMYVTALPEFFLTYIKISLYASIFLVAPWIFYQLWGFIATGLYPMEKKFVNTFVPFSAILFLMGGLFFITVVAPITCNFFIDFASEIKTPELNDNFTTRWLNKVFDKDVDLTTPENVTPTPPPTTTPNEQNSLIRLIPKLDQYVSLVMLLALAFSIGFQMPLVVFFLGRLGLVRIETFCEVRKYVLLGIFVLSAVMTPPDIISQVALSLPMYVLYELGIVMLRFRAKSIGLPRE